MTIRSKTICDSCGKEIDHLAQRWYSVSTVTRDQQGAARSEAQHACDPDCFEKLLARVHQASTVDADNCRKAKALAAASDKGR